MGTSWPGIHPSRSLFQVVHPVHMMVTPRVVDEARRHFACDQLEGAELENQGGDGTALTHWEKRVFEVVQDFSAKFETSFRMALFRTKP